MKKVFIYGWFSFPRGGANANYIQYLALSLMKAGYDTTVVCNIAQQSCCEYDSINGVYKYKNIPVIFLKESHIRTLHYVQYNYLRGHMFVDAIRSAGASAGDWIIAYSYHSIELKPIFHYAKSIGARTAICIPEYYTREVFATEAKFKKYISCMENIVPMADVLFPISEFIYKKYDKNKSMILPCMADTSEYVYQRDTSLSDKIQIIYATNGWVKDSLKDMLHSLLLLPERYQNRIRLHLTGVKPKSVLDLNDERINNLLGSVIELHSWMTYDQLVELYLKMDFIFIARPDTPFFQANFSSKLPEAMTYGVVPIVSKVGDYTKYYLTDGIDSVQFDGFNPEACAKALTRAINISPTSIEKMRINARNMVKERLNFDVWSETIKTFLDSHQSS